MSHYFEYDKNLKSDKRQVKYYIKGQELSFTSDIGVFSKNAVDFGTKTLIDVSLDHCFDGHGLDLGCGIGIVGITMMMAGKNLVFDMVDINERSVGLTKENASKYHLDEKCFISVSDGFENIIKKDYDFILTNPPIRAGKKVVYSFFEGSYEHLKQGGILLVVIQKKQGAPSAKDKLESVFGNCEIVEKNKGYYILKCVK